MSMDDLIYKPPQEVIEIEINGTIYPWEVRGFSTDEIEELASINAVQYITDPTRDRPAARLNYGLLRRHMIFEGVVTPPEVIPEWTLEIVKSLKSEVRNRLWDAIETLSDEVELYLKKSGQLSKGTE